MTLSEYLSQQPVKVKRVAKNKLRADQIEAQLEALKLVLTKPLTRKEIHALTGIGTLQTKLHKWVADGNIYMQQRVSNGIKCNYYSENEFAIATLQIDVLPDYEVVSENTPTSTTHRLTDTVHWTSNKYSKRVYVGSTLGNAI